MLKNPKQVYMTMNKSSLKLIVSFSKGDVDLSIFKEQAELFFVNVLKGEFNEYKVAVDEPHCISIDDVYVTNIHEAEISLSYSPAKEYTYIVSNIMQAWCSPEKNKLSHLWLRLSDPSVLENSGTLCHADVQVKEIAFGTFPDMLHFMSHYHYDSNSYEKEIMSTFLHSQRQFLLYTCFSHLENCNRNEIFHNKFLFFYHSLSYVVINFLPGSDTVQVFFHLQHCPFVYCGRSKEQESSKLACNQEYQEKNWSRALEFGCKCKRSLCSIDRIGRCPVFKMILPKKHKTHNIIERLIQRCPRSTLFYFANIKTLYPQKRVKYIYDDFENFPFDQSLEQSYSDENLVDDINFKCQFAWRSVISRSLEVRDQIFLKYEFDSSKEHWENLKNLLTAYLKKDCDAVVESLHKIAEMISKNFIFSFEQALKQLIKHYHKHKHDNKLPDGMCFVRRIILCPSRIICIPPSEHFDNRVMREFGAENFLRVSIQDDNFTKLTPAVQYGIGRAEFMWKVIKEPLLNGIQIGPRLYEILASSNSQLREHGLYMYAKDHKGNTAASIRDWMGNFRHIKNVAKYMARMGQCFSTSDEAVQIELDDDEVIEVEELLTEDGKYKFSDGVGMISKDLAQEIRDAFAERSELMFSRKEYMYDPSAFQIRFKGCKGMVAESKTLKKHKFAFRPSMKKFTCDSSNKLEIVKISAPRQVFLNRPLICILENLKVEKQVFIDLQKKMVFNLTDSLIYERKARKLLENSTSLDFPFKELSDVGISMTGEPFFRSLLLAIYKSFIENLKTKARIEIPHKYGRNMMGVIDETGTLKEDQIFAQYSEQVGLIKSPTRILKGAVVVTKNPCMHPGDVRKFQAIDVPALHHIKDCIVFPAQGDRPLTDQMAGSDLDGDEYVVIWYPTLIFPRDNCDAMEYPANEEITLDKDIEVSDMVDFLCRYIQDDNIGRMANAFLAWADYYDNGVYSEVCMSIAQKYPKALDFAKSGTTCSLKPNERPYCYPDFMEKGYRNNSYKSTKSLGVLYRMIRNLEASVSTIDDKISVEPDKKLEYPGWQEFKHLAEKRKKQYSKRVKSILNKYGLQTEAETLTGYVRKLNDYNNNKYDTENVVSLSKKCLIDNIKYYRLKFLEDYRCSSDVYLKKEENERKYKMASAWYMVTYQEEEPSILSFPWVVSDILCEIRKINCGREMHISKSAIIDSSDEVLHSIIKGVSGGRELSNCDCFILLSHMIMSWIKLSSFMLILPDGAFCSYCFQRIAVNFKSCSAKCCSVSENGCSCVDSCSPTKLILKFLKYYASEVVTDIEECGSKRPDSNICCEGFKGSNLQSLALKTYAAFAITQNLQDLGIVERSGTKIICDSNEEGDPIRIPVTREFEEIIIENVEKVRDILKELTGVKEILIDGSPEKKGFYILIHSIGSTLQRWNLEELIMDDDCPSKIKSRLQ